MPDGFQLLRRGDCRICGSTNLTPYLDLGGQPPSNSFIEPSQIASEQVFPLTVYLCGDCGLSQLLDVVSATDIFDDYLYLSSTSKALCAHYQGLVSSVLADFQPAEGALAVDIGCNDGIMLNRYPEGRYRLLGIEPSSAGEYARKAGFEVVDGFFTDALGSELQQSHGGAAIVTATNVFAHVDDIRSFAAGIRNLLAPDGVAIFEFPYLADMLEQHYFDTIYHEHLCYLALSPLDHLFSETGLRAFRVGRTDMGASGPALRLFVCHAGAAFETEPPVTALMDSERAWGVKSLGRYQKFAAEVAEIKGRVLALISQVRDQGHKIGAFGAPAKGNTLLNYLGLGAGDILAAAENNDLKIGKVTPGSHIPVVGDEEFLAAGISHALLLSWNYLDFFLENAEFIRRGGKFIVPLPKPGIRP